MKKWQDNVRPIPDIVRDRTVHVIAFDDAPCSYGGWNTVVMGHDGVGPTKTLYVVPETAEVKPRADGIMYVVRDLNHIVTTTKTGFSVVEVEILGQVPKLGKKIEVEFHWEEDRRSGKSNWRVVLNDREVSVILSPEDDQAVKLGPKTKTNRPRWVVIPRRQVFCSGSGKFRILKVELVKQIFASPRAERRQQQNGGEQSSSKPLPSKAPMRIMYPLPGQSIIADMITNPPKI